jgi:hypothetical protein
MLWRSVVSAGVLQVRVTVFPLRMARKSEGGLGNSREGGSGAPVWAQPASNTQRIATKPSLQAVIGRKRSSKERSEEKE